MKSSLINDIEIEGVRDALNILAKAGTEDLFEKAKHQIGDSHPKWPQLKWTDLGGGKFGWRTGTGKGKRGNTNTSSGDNGGSNSGEQKDLSTYVKETDTKTLKNVANSDKAPKDLKDAAKKELQNRGEQVQPDKTDTTEKKQKKLRPVGTGTLGPTRKTKEEKPKYSAFVTKTINKLKDVLDYRNFSDERIEKLADAMSKDEATAKKIYSAKFTPNGPVNKYFRLDISRNEIDIDENTKLICEAEKNLDTSYSGDPKNRYSVEYRIFLKERPFYANKRLLGSSHGGSFTNLTPAEVKERCVMEALLTYYSI